MTIFIPWVRPCLLLYVASSRRSKYDMIWIYTYLWISVHISIYLSYIYIYGGRGIAPRRDCAHERNLSLYGVLVQYAVSRLRVWNCRGTPWEESRVGGITLEPCKPYLLIWPLQVARTVSFCNLYPIAPFLSDWQYQSFLGELFFWKF